MVRRSPRELTAAALENLLKSSGLTQEKFARSIGVSRSTVSHIINATKPTTKNPVDVSSNMLARVQGVTAVWQEVRKEMAKDVGLGPLEYKGESQILRAPSLEFLDDIEWILRSFLEVVRTTKAEMNRRKSSGGNGAANTSEKSSHKVQSALKSAAKAAGMPLPRATGVMPPKKVARKRSEKKAQSKRKRQLKPAKGRVFSCRDKRRPGMVRVVSIDTKNDRIHVEPYGGGRKVSTWHKLSDFVNRYKHVR